MMPGRSELFLDVTKELLAAGRQVRFRATGHSMHPTIRNGETILVEPVAAEDLKTGDIALFEARRGVTAHRVTEIATQGERTVFVTRGDALDAPDEPVGTEKLLGRVAALERAGRAVDLKSRRTTMEEFLSKRIARRARHSMKYFASRSAYFVPGALMLCLLLLSPGAARGQSIGTPTNIGGSASGSGTSSKTITATVSTGNTIIVTVGYEAANSTAVTVTVSDTKSNTYHQDLCTSNTSSPYINTCIFSAPVTTALSSGTITISFNHSVTPSVNAFYVSGLLSSSPADKTASSFSNTAGSSASSGATATTTQPVELLVGSIAVTTAPGSLAAGTGYTELTYQQAAGDVGLASEYEKVSATGAYTATSGTISPSQEWAAGIVTYKATAGTASKLAFTTQPGGGTGGTAWTTQPVVTVEDSSGDPVTSSTASITLAIGTNPGSGTLGCTTNPLSATAGVATFAGCEINKAGTGYTLTATSSGLTTATSSTFNITAGTATHLAFTTSAVSVAAGSCSGVITVTSEDAGGNASDPASTETIALSSTSTGTKAFYTTSACSTSETSVTIATSASAASFYYKDTLEGTPTVTASGTGAYSSAPTQVETVTAGTATQLIFTTQPGGGQATVVWASFNQPVVTIEDTYGNTVTSSSASVTLTPSSTSISCTSNPLAATSGVATFAGCQMPTVGSYTLTASITSPSLSVTSNSFSIVSVTAVTVTSLKAVSSGHGNLVMMQTGREVGNLGFNIYREQNGQRVKLNSSLLAGSALMGGAATTFTAGHTRTWQDDLPGDAGSAAYWVEEVDLHGARTWYGPVMPEGSSVSDSRVSGSSAAHVQAVSASPAAVRAGAPTVSQAVPLSSIGRASTAAVTIPLPPVAVATGNSQNQFSLASSPAIKLAVTAEGWYRVTAAQLTAAGLDAHANPSSLHLYVSGTEVPMEVETSGPNQVAAIDFYGLPVDTVWSGTQEYWLTAGQPFGLRMLDAQTRPNAPAAGASFPFSLLWKPRTLYFAALLNGDGNNFFGPVLDSGDPLSQSITVTHLNTGTAGTSPLQVTLQGATAGPHAVTVTLNGNLLGTMSFSDMANYTSTFEVPNGELIEGSNTLALAVTGGATDVSVVDHVVLTYPHSYVADGNYLRLTAPAGTLVSITGFTDPTVQVIDVTNPSAPELVPAAGPAARAVSTAATAFVTPGVGTRTLLAVGSSQIASPAAIAATAGSSWHTPQKGGDMVIVTHSSLLTAVAPLAALRQSQGHTVKVIDVDDLYNEFNYGVESPYAIQSFLESANSNWQTKPAFVLLVGNGTFDPRDYLQTSVPNLVPAKLVDTSLLETASDDWFADFNNDGIPEMAVGRIPAESAAEATNAINRLIAYDQSGSGGWKTKALFVAGVDEDPGDNFESYAAAVQALMPASVTASSILAGSDANAAADIVTALTAGQALVNYTGHGSNEIWADGLMSSTEALGLTNGGLTPFVLSMTCLNGYFQDVYTDPLGKALLNATGGGAVAVWASSGLTDPSPQSNINQAMVTALYGTPGITIGQAAKAAKSATTDLDVRRTWNLLGDPSMKLQ